MTEEVYQLIVNEGLEPGHSFQLALDMIIIGRDQYSDIVFDHPEISRHHARLTRSDSGYVLQDLGSTNGTFVDGKQLGNESVLLQTGMIIRLGGVVTLRFQSHSPGDPVTATTSSSLVDGTAASEPGTRPVMSDTVTLIAAMSMDNPYVGPRAFEANERQFFYGRDDEIAILTGQVMSRRASVFFAQSGAGKSSLLRAGLIPDLTRKSKAGRGPRARTIQKMRVMPILDVGYNPTDEQMKVIDNVYVLGALLSLYPKRTVEELATLTLCEGLAPYFDESSGSSPDESGAAAMAGDKKLSTLLIFDQFEELFTYHPEQWRKREDFFRQVNQALTQYPTLHVVFTMREDFIAELTPFANLLPDQLRARFRLERLKRDAALQAIVAPAEKAGRTFAKGVAEELVDNLRRGQPKQDRAGSQASVKSELGAYVEPVHLQIVCRQLWENLPAKRKVIEAADVQAFGDVDQALTGFYESTLAEVTARTNVNQRQLRAWFNNEVITPARTRGLVYRGEEEAEGLPNAAADILNDAYIIRADVRGGDIWYQLAHDRLVEPILEANVVWRENYQNPLDKVTQAWLAAGRDPERLLAGTQLAIAQSYADDNPSELLPEEEEFLRESHRQEKLAAERAEVQARRRRRTIIAAVVVAVILLAATIFAVIQSQIAKQEAQRAQDNEARAEQEAQRAAEARDDAEFQAARAEEEAKRAQDNADLAAARAEEAQQAQMEAETQRDEAERQQLEAEKQRLEAEKQRLEAEKQREEARRQTRLSLAEGLAANALAENSAEINDPSLALILAREAVDVTQSEYGTVQDNARRALLEAVADAPPWQMNLPRYAHDGPVTRSDFSPDGQHLVSGSTDGTAKVWDLASGVTVLTLDGHTSAVNSAVYSPDGTMIVTASGDNTSRVWDATSGDLLLELEGHDDGVEYATFDADGDRIVTAGADKVAIVWETNSGEQTAKLAGHRDSVQAAHFNPQGDRIVTAGADGIAIVWDAETGQQLLVLQGEDDFVTWAIYDDSGERIATTTLDGLIRVWNATTGEVLFSIEGSNDSIVSAMFSSDGEQLVSAGWDGKAGVYNSRDGDLLHVLEGHVGQLSYADFSPDDQQILTTGDDRTIRLWDAATAEQLSVFGGSGGAVTRADFSGDGARLAVGTESGAAIVWDMATGDDLGRIDAHDSAISGLDFSPDGRLIVTAGVDGPARVWDAESGALVRVLDGHDGAATDVAFSPDSSAIATVGTDDQLIVWDAGTGSQLITRSNIVRTGGLDYVTFSADGTRIATYSEADGRIGIWGATTGDPFLSMSNKFGTSSIQFSPDGRNIVTGNHDRTVYIWDSYSGRLVDFYEAHANLVRSAAYSPDGAYIVSASDDATARVWNVETGEEEHTLLGHGDWLTSATFSPDGKLIVSTDLDGVTKVWNIAAPALIPELEHDGSPITFAAFTPDGQRLVTAGDDSTLNVWSVENSRKVHSFAGSNLDETPFDGSNSLAILPIKDESGLISLWDVNNGEVLATLAGHDEGVSKADISADGRTVVTLGCDEQGPDNDICAVGTAKIWDGTSGEEVLSLPYEAINDDEVLAFELSRDGSRLVTSSCIEFDEEESACLNNQLTTWDTATGEEVVSWSTGTGQNRWIDFSPDRASIFSTDGAETWIWDAASGELLGTLPGQYKATDPQGACVVTLIDDLTAMIWDARTGAHLGTIEGHRDLINSIEFSPDSERLITSSWDGTARVWNSRTGIEILNLTDHEGQVWQAHFSPDGNSIVTASEDGAARIWPFAAEKLLELSAPAVQRYSPFLTPLELARFGLAER